MRNPFARSPLRVRQLRNPRYHVGSTVAESHTTNPSLCLVVPCYNEEEMLPAFFKVVVPQLEAATGGSWRIVCVDDGSRDNTFSIIASEHVADTRISGVRLSRNFGHQPAVSVGLAFAAGD